MTKTSTLEGGWNGPRVTLMAHRRQTSNGRNFDNFQPPADVGDLLSAF
jgi:hypothetical protein